MSKATGILGVVLAGLLAAGTGVTFAQDKPAGQDKPAAQDKDKQETAAADPLSGQWQGSVETPNGTITFTLTLKVEKDKVSGDIASNEGSSPLTGTWVESKLSASFDYNGTPMTMTGAIKDDALGGEMNYGGGQAVMNWTAKRRAKT